MKCAIMQPYFFPYIGYFQLISAVDNFVLYDDVNFIKGGWINRNFIWGRNGPQRITLQLTGASPNKLINQVDTGGNEVKLLRTIEQTYSKAPYFKSVFPLLESCLETKEHHLSSLVCQSIRRVCDYLDIQSKLLLSSNIEKNNTHKGAQKVIDICKILHASTYINSIGGKALYDKVNFAENGVSLYFLASGDIQYKQYSDTFLPNLSIIDMMMFNPKSQISEFLKVYDLV